MQKLGQHFLKNEVIAAKIAQQALSYNLPIIEIGPGKGALTKHLLTAKRVVAIEMDKKLAQSLPEAMGFPKNLEVIEGDAREKLPELAQYIGRDFIVAANLPYYLTSYILRVISNLPQKPRCCVLLVQKEVAERVVGKQGQNKLSAATSYWGKPSMLMSVPARYFSPPPKVESAVLVIDLKDKDEAVLGGAYFEAVRRLFKQPGKTIINNLKEGGLTKQAAEKMLEDIGISGTIRPRQLTYENICAIGRALGESVDIS